MLSSPNRKPLLLILLLFIAPVALSLVLQQLDWRSEVKTHGSVLSQGNHSFETLGLDNPLPGKWQLVYRLDSPCDTQCRNSLYAQQQVWQALAVERKRIKPVVLIGSDQQLPDDPRLDKSLFTIQHLDDAARQRTRILADTVYLYDTHGQQVLSYAFAMDQQKAVLQAKELLLDVKQLLKLSRIG